MDPEPLRKMDVFAVMNKKDEIEGEIKELNTVLQTQQDVGMTGPLVDNEGFPRDNIDIYAVRHARNQIIRLQNDHKVMMKVIEEKLHHIHSDARLSRTGEEGGDDSSSSHRSGKPFLTVTEVTPTSPADSAGLQVGDGVAEFGSVKAENFKSMTDVASVVKYSENNSLRIVLVREGKTQAMSLIPKRWSGPGLLGCRLVPLENCPSV